jgi:hypothetical protein
MGWTRLLDRRKDRRTAVIDAFEFPSGVRQRFAGQHHALTAEDIALVEAATRQWFRLAARHPRAKLSMPSVVVDDLWHELVLHTREYEAFCQAAFGRFLHHVPESAMASPEAAANRSTRLVATFHLARQDEGCGPDQLPVLFRVDQRLPVAGGRRYLADCGGRGQCHELRGTVCLHHLTGPGKAPSRPGKALYGAWGGIPAPYGADGGAGCGVDGGGDGR